MSFFSVIKGLFNGQPKEIKVDESGSMFTVPNSVTSLTNNLTSTFTSGSAWSGSAELNTYRDVMVVCKTDGVAILYMDFSPDGTNWDSTLTFQITGSTPEFHIAEKGPRYYRTRILPSVSSTYTRLYTYYGNFRQGNVPLNAAVGQDSDAIMVRQTDYAIAVQKGLFTGITFINKFGRNPATATGDAIWAVSTAYTEPATAEVCNVKSTSTQDDFGGGTGAGKITITGIDENYDIVTEVVELNGTTNVLTVNKYWNIHRAYVSAKAPSGTDAGAVGTITIITTAAGTPTIGNIAIGYNQTQITIYMVPRGYTAYVNLPNVTGQNTTGNSTCDIGFFKKDFGGVFRVQGEHYLTGGATAYIPKVYGAPFKIEEKSTILFKCITSAGGGTWDVTVDYDIWLVKNS